VFLVTLAYQISLDIPLVPASFRIKAALELSDAGLIMIQGQVHDMRQDLEEGTAEEALAPLLSAEECVALWSRGQDGWHSDRRG
jgi:hypothetical protein